MQKNYLRRASLSKFSLVSLVLVFIILCSIQEAYAKNLEGSDFDWTPKCAKKGTKVKLSVKIKNNSDKPIKVKVTFKADPPGGDTCTTDDVEIQPGKEAGFDGEIEVKQDPPHCYCYETEPEDPSECRCETCEITDGGVWVPVDKFGLLTPYIGLASTVVVATAATAICIKRVKRRKEKW